MWKGLKGATGNLYCGLQEFEDMAFVLHFLREDDLFVDIGANIGSYTVLGASEVGAETVSIEPIPQTFKTLKINIALNNIESKTKVYNIGLGSKRGILKFTTWLDTINHVTTCQGTDGIDVQVERFDDIIEIKKPALIKIDVEGFEVEVLKVMEKALSNPYLKAIIIELNGVGNRYGYNEEEIHNMFLDYNFNAFIYSPLERKMIPVEKFGVRHVNYNSENTIYIRDIALAQERILSAKKI
ncbi:FkbM family methyltransferase [Pontibacter toksunensis]|uniref:FkbM family methyltransferase n=1 Tax=Pontibacter toksunensis TaxID=1332631 RepID=A0ABW6BN40_9BACT